MTPQAEKEKVTEKEEIVSPIMVDVDESTIMKNLFYLKEQQKKQKYVNNVATVNHECKLLFKYEFQSSNINVLMH